MSFWCIQGSSIPSWAFQPNHIGCAILPCVPIMEIVIEEFESYWFKWMESGPGTRLPPPPQVFMDDITTVASKDKWVEEVLGRLEDLIGRCSMCFKADPWGEGKLHCEARWLEQRQVQQSCNNRYFTCSGLSLDIRLWAGHTYTCERTTPKRSVLRNQICVRSCHESGPEPITTRLMITNETIIDFFVITFEKVENAGTGGMLMHLNAL